MEYTHKPAEELTFTDDFMFGTVMKNQFICKGVIERLLHIKVGKINIPRCKKRSLRFTKARAYASTSMFPTPSASSISKYKRHFRLFFPSVRVIIKVSWMSITSCEVRVMRN